MLFSTVLVSFGIQVAALAASNLVLSPDGSIESIANATAMGIDVHGPIPNDAVKVRDGYFTAEPGTKAWAWIRAQIDLTSDGEPGAKHGKRQQYANIGIGMFVSDNCTGQAAWFDNVFYGYQYWTTVNMFSVGISYRGLRSNEQLDFSRRNAAEYCGTYLYSAAKDTPGKGPAGNCFVASKNNHSNLIRAQSAASTHS